MFLRRACCRFLSQSMASGLQRDWDLAVNAIELNDGPVYFCSEKVLSDPSTRDIIKPHHETFAETFHGNFPSTISFAFTACNPGDVSQSDVKNAIDYDKLQKELDLATTKQPGVTVKGSYGFFQDDSSHFERGFFLTASNDTDVAKQTRKFVNEICLKYGQAGYFEYNMRGRCIYQDLVSVPDQKVEAVSPLVQVVAPPCHPAFSHSNYHSVFHSVTKLQQVLSEMKVLELDGVKQLLTLAAQQSIPLEGGEIPLVEAKNPDIIVEGLDATGKSTLCQRLSESLNATLLGTPPSCLKELRATFDAYPPLIRRAFYTLGNYIAAQEIATVSKSGPVVVDRFWHSSAAYAIATEVGCGDVTAIPPKGHDVYKWPQDLLKPEVAILLVVCPEERRRRILARGEQLTEEEMRLDSSSHFQERLLECYRRMCDPCLDIVDASGTPDDVLHSVLDCIKKRVPCL